MEEGRGGGERRGRSKVCGDNSLRKLERDWRREGTVSYRDT
jgi:hypothetical protein